MAENSENIEAKLCAYVEGDLDDAGRVEIERHLEAHPNHRRLLSELMATRDLLRYLPREQAPPELAESFNAQLERSALLDGAGVDAAGIGAATYRANLIPRLMAMAAIVLLAVGLGAVVYFALPRGESGTKLAMPAMTPASRTVTDGDVDAFARAADEAPAASDAVAPVGEASRERMGKIGPAQPGEGMASKHGTIAPDADRVFGGSGGGGAGQAPAYVIVSADNLNDALREITDNLSQSGIRWEPATEPAPAPLDLRANQVVVTAPRAGSAYLRLELDNALQKKAEYGQRQVAQQQQLARQATAAQTQQHALEPDAGALARSGAKDDGGPGDRDVSPAQAPDAAKPPPAEAALGALEDQTASPPPAVASAGQDAKLKAAADRRRIASNTIEPSPDADSIAQAEEVAEAAAPTTRPSDASRAIAAGQGAASVDESFDLKKELSQAAQAPGAVGAETDVAGVVAYGMTPRQVMELSRKLNRAPQVVEVIADNAELQVANESLRHEQQLQQGQPAEEYAEAAPADPAAAIASAPAAEEPMDLATRHAGTADAPAAAPAAAPAPEADKTQVSAKPSAEPQPSAFATKEGPAPGASNRASKQGVPSTNGAAVAGQRPARPELPQAATGAGAGTAGKTANRAREQIAARHGTGRPGVIRRGERLSVTVDELAGPDIGSTHPAIVAADGSIRLPKLDQPVQVEGLSRGEAEARIADAYRSSQLIDAAHVSVEPAPMPVREGKGVGTTAQAPDKAAPTTAPADAVAQAVEEPLAPATTQSFGTQSAETQPATEERLDVVILVQRTAAAPAVPAGAQPTTDLAQDQDDAPNAAARESGVDESPTEPAQPAQE